jgi:effector-binding domain-containing protein
LTVTADKQLEIEAGLPVPAAVTPADDVLAGVLAAGRYATLDHVGRPDALMDVTAELLDWAARQGHHWDVAETKDGQHWGCRLEILKTDPREQPDMAKWTTELAFRLAD